MARFGPSNRSFSSPPSLPSLVRHVLPSHIQDWNCYPRYVADRFLFSPPLLTLRPSCSPSGAGLFTKLAYVPSLLPHASIVSLKAIYSRSASSAASLAAEASEKLPSLKAEDIALYSDDGEQGGLDELLKRDDITAILIALPIPQISEAIIKSLEAGKHVLR